MKKAIALFVVVCALGAGVYFRMCNSSGSVATSAEPLPVASSVERGAASQNPKARAIASPGDVAQVMGAPKVNWDVRECEGYWKSLTNVSFADFSEALPSKTLAAMRQLKDVGAFVRVVKSLAAPEGCRNLPESHPASQLHHDVQMACAAALGEASVLLEKEPKLLLQSRNLQQCFLTLQQYQSTMQYLALGDAPVGKMTDRASLNTIMKGPLVGPGMDVTRKAEAAERLVELDPANAEAARFLVYNRLLEAHLTNAGDDAKLKAAVETLEHADPKSAFGNEVRISLAKEKGDVGAIREIAAAMTNNPEQKDLGAYYQAYASYLDNDTAGAKAKLTELVAADPNNFVAKQALEKLEKPPAKESREPVFLEFVSQVGASPRQ